MRRNRFKLSKLTGRVVSTAVFALFVAFGVQPTAAQSSDVNFPTPLGSSKLTGTIKARDIGDSRLTTHYFVFNGTQGDLFVNVVAKNLDADIDVFAADGLIPLAKMVVASDAQANETGRLIYLRKPEKLILRIQGRTPNDLPATYQISFGGGFAVIEGQESPDAPVVDSSISGEVAVNSVGTILPQPKKEVARTEPSKPSEPEPVAEKQVEAERKDAETAKVVTSENDPDKPKTEAKRSKKGKENRRAEVVVTESVEPKAEVAKKKPEKKAEKRPRRSAKKEKKPEPPVDPLANVKLVILFKNGEKVEIGMPDLMKFTVDRGQLLVIRKTGSIDRYSMLDVAKVTIE